MNIEEFKGKLSNVKETSDGKYTASCPICDKGTKKQHLLFRQGADKIDLNCVKGCDGIAIMEALGQHIRDRYANSCTKDNKKILATYDYKNENGALVYQAVRYTPKDFRQRRPDGNGSWIYDLKNTTLYPYNLPALIANRTDKQTVFICEGEKDCDNLIKQGLIASCNPMGAGASKWRTSFNQYYQDMPVVIIADKDEVGRTHANHVAFELFPVTSSVKIIEMPNAGVFKVKDVSDWLDCGGTKDQLQELAESIPAIQASEIDSMKPTHKAPAKTAAKEKKEIEAYYDAVKKEYLIKNFRGAWLHLKESQFRVTLRSWGYDSNGDDGELSEVDQILIDLRDKKDIVYAGKVAGLMAGYYEDERILVTESPKIIEPKAGDWSTLKSFIDGLLDEEGLNQPLYLYGWLKVGYMAVRAGRKMPGQALVICGEHNCGKSFLQLLITEILGGRFAKPGQYMKGETPFNSDLLGAEHLMLEDENSSTDIRARREFGSRIKDITVNQSQRCHAKGRDAFSLKPFWRLSVSLNDEAENLMILPPIDASIEDKMIILRAHKTPMPMPTSTFEERDAFWKKMIDELPAFLDYLVNMDIPNDLISQRFGITHFHHPEILNEINTLAPEAKLLSLIDEVIDREWTGTAEELEKRLCVDPATQYEAKKLFTWNNACGTYLGRLARSYPERVVKNSHHGEQRTWHIKPVQKTGGTSGFKVLDGGTLDGFMSGGGTTETLGTSSLQITETVADVAVIPQAGSHDEVEPVATSGPDLYDVLLKGF